MLTQTSASHCTPVLQNVFNSTRLFQYRCIQSYRSWDFKNQVCQYETFWPSPLHVRTWESMNKFCFFAYSFDLPPFKNLSLHSSPHFNSVMVVEYTSFDQSSGTFSASYSTTLTTGYKERVSQFSSGEMCCRLKRGGGTGIKLATSLTKNTRFTPHTHRLSKEQATSKDRLILSDAAQSMNTLCQIYTAS